MDNQDLLTKDIFDKKHNLTMVDIFCGAGIGAVGFKEAGYKIKYAVDNSQYAVDTYNKNIGNHAHCKDVTKLPFDDIPEADVYTAGFPCQPFSVAGSGLGVEDPKAGNLGNYFLNLVKEKKPRAFIIENVKGITSTKNYPFFNSLIDSFIASGYKVSWKLINCYHYGVPQLRERVFMVGVRDEGKRFIFPEPIKEELRLSIRDAIGDLPDPSSDHSIFNHKEFYTGGFSSRFTSRNRQKQWDEPSFTICSSARQLPLYPEPANYDIREHREFTQDAPRRFTVRECLRLQTAPDTFHFDECIPFMKQHIRCSGIPSRIAYLISLELARLIENDDT
tara:strand:- start:1259 stop:2260 length:1002 start_codon:yes stop_codon:yes gene_type:complete